MFGHGAGWAITSPTHSLVVAVGSICPKPGVVDGQICARDYLHLTLVFDHAAVDGAPAARFAARLVSLIEQGHGLEAACGDVHAPPAVYVTYET
jgi:pyruvate/2-oxoglutarate dehydrogenase complex dihydrolipoamide acyltransferase (E2) component